MGLNIAEIAETIEFNKDDLKGNRQLTNEMLVDDIMIGLGYNKKRDKNVHRMFDDIIDWKVTTDSGKQIAVKVLSYDELPHDFKDMQETIDFCLKSRFSVLLIINGEIIRVMRYDKKDHVYNKAYDIYLTNNDGMTPEETGERAALINAICKESFSTDYIDSKLKPKFTYEQFLQVVASKLGSISEISSLNKEVIQEYTDKLLGNQSNTGVEETTVPVNTFELDQLKSRVTELESDNARLIDEKTDLGNKIIELEESIQEKVRIEQEKDAELLKIKQSLTDLEEGIQNNSTDTQKFEDKIVALSQENADIKQQLQDKANEIEDLKASTEKLNEQLQDKENNITELNVQLQSKDREIEELKASVSTDDTSKDVSSDVDDYIAQIKEMAIKLSDAIEEKEAVQEELNKARAEIEELNGSDIRMAERLLESVDDDPEDDRSYVAVIDKELLNYEDIHTFIGRCLQKLYDIKSFDASRYLFDGDIFELDRNPKFSDLVMGNATYDIIIKTSNENEELNKLRTVFSHFDDIVFVCKKIGTLRKSINSRYGELPDDNTPVIKMESDSYIDDSVEFGDEMPPQDDSSSENYSSEASQGFDDNQHFGTQQFGEIPLESMSGAGYDDEAVETQLDQNTEFDATQNYEGQIPYFDDSVEQNVEEPMSKQLLVAQLLNIDMLIWSEEKVVFNNIKYISTNTITFGISQTVESFDKLLCKCIDAVLAIEAFNGSKNLISTLKQKDFSQVSNFIKSYSPEYSQYPRINGTKYVVVDIASIQQVASTLLDICTFMSIDTQEIFLYFEAETNSQYIIENFNFDENAIRLNETNSYVPEEDTEPNEATAIIRGDMFNHIMITKNSLKVHKEILLKAIAVRTKYLGVVIENNDKVYEIIGDIVATGYKEGMPVEYRAIGNVIGESYLLVSEDESRVNADHVTLNVGGHTIHISRLEDWQAIHSIIKAHTAIFNNTSIAVKSSVNADAINFYGKEFVTSEPSLGLAVNSFVDYVAGCIKE